MTGFTVEDVSIQSSKSAKLLKITLPLRFFKNPSYNVSIYSVRHQLFNKNGLQNKLWLAAFLTDSEILQMFKDNSAFDFTYEIVKKN